MIKINRFWSRTEYTFWSAAVRCKWRERQPWPHSSRMLILQSFPALHKRCAVTIKYGVLPSKVIFRDISSPVKAAISYMFVNIVVVRAMKPFELKKILLSRFHEASLSLITQQCTKFCMCVWEWLKYFLPSIFNGEFSWSYDSIIIY